MKVQTFQPVEGNRHWHGRLTEVGEKAIVLDLSAVRQKGKAARARPRRQTVELELANVEKANLVAGNLGSGHLVPADYERGRAVHWGTQWSSGREEYGELLYERLKR